MFSLASPSTCRACHRQAVQRLAGAERMTLQRVNTGRTFASSSRILQAAEASPSSSSTAPSPAPASAPSSSISQQKSLSAPSRLENFPAPHNLSEPQLALQSPPTHPKTHGIHVASLHLSAHHPSVLTQFTDFALHAAYSLGIPCSKAASLPVTRSLYTVIKSPFVHKKAQENFERKNHKRVIKVWDADAEVVDKWLRYLKKYSLAGVGVKATMHEWTEFGVGRKDMDEALRPFNASSSSTSATNQAAEENGAASDEHIQIQQAVEQLKKDLLHDVETDASRRSGKK